MAMQEKGNRKARGIAISRERRRVFRGSIERQTG
jgi:hypothetical protein